jgi:phosphatidylserine decarboxylase
MFGFTRIENRYIKNSFISWFVKSYKVDLSEAVIDNPKDYKNFNEFFTRKLKPNSRIIEDSKIICPVDGVVSQIGCIRDSKIIQAKGHLFTVSKLLAGDSRSVDYKNGFFATVYLSPKDYHRIHIPYDGILISMSYIPGDLFSVNNKTTRKVDGLFARNERVVCYFETEFGLCALILVGAIFVGSMQTVWDGQITPPYGKKVRTQDYKERHIEFKKGDEIARFNMGSTVIMLMPNNNKLNINESQKVKMGQSIY